MTETAPMVINGTAPPAAPPTVTVPAAPGTPGTSVPAPGTPGTPSLIKTSTPPPPENERERPVPVDNPTLPATGVHTEKRRPIIPGWLRTRSDFAATTRHAGGRAGYATAYHGLRIPWYTARLTGMAPRGACRFVASTGSWVWDREAAPLRAAAVREEDAPEYRALAKLRAGRVRLRGLVVLVAAVFGTAVALALYVLAPAWLYAVGSMAVLALGYAGQEKDSPVIGPAVLRTEVEKLTSTIVERALGAIGNDKLNKALAKGGEGIHYPSPIMREGPGYRCEVDLPHGVTAADVIARRTALSSGLRRPLGAVWPEGDPTVHEGRLILWVGDRDLSKTGIVKWPLATTGSQDYFKPVPFGNDPRGRTIEVRLFQHNVLIGSQPGQGKTASVRVLTAGASLDPTCELWIHENKGTGDLEAFERVSHRYVSGIDDTSIEYAADSLALLRKEVMRRSQALSNVPLEMRPDKMLTRQIANAKHFKLHPLVAVFDECQNVFAHEDFGEQAGKDAEFVIKVGRALGVTLILATQRPDSKSLPTGVSANASTRFCLRVGGQLENDMILGTSAYKNGIRATTFRPEIDAGNGYLSGVTPVPVVVRTAYIDGPEAERIGQRAYAMREAAGTLSGHALDEAPERAKPAFDLLADVLAVVPTSEEKVWLERVVDRLAQMRPEVYGPWTELEPKAKVMQLSTALKPHGVPIKDVWGTTDDGKGTTKRGIDRSTVTDAVAERDRKRAAS